MQAQKPLWMMSLLALSTSVLADAQGGFLEDSALKLVNRNYYFNNDYHNGWGDTREWGHSILWQYKSGYTQGLVGFGVDAHLYSAFALDSGGGRRGSQMFVQNSDGSIEETSSAGGGAVKMRISQSELKYGNLRPYNPVFALGDPRLMPATATGFQFTSADIDGLSLDAGYFTAAKDYNQTHSDGGFYAGYASYFKGVDVEAGNVSYLGGAYSFTDNLSMTLYASQYDELWNQYYANGNYNLVLGESSALNFDLNYYHSQDQGEARAGAIDVDAWSAGVGYTFGAHTLTLGYQQIDGDQPFDYLRLEGGGFQDSIYLGNASQYADFNGPNERSWRIQYDLDFAPLGLPGASFSIRHVRGYDIDGTGTAADSAYFGAYGKNEEHNTTDLDLKYVVQSGAAKDLMIRVRHAHHNMTSGSSDGDVDRFRVVFEYPLSIL